MKTGKSYSNIKKYWDTTISNQTHRLKQKPWPQGILYERKYRQVSKGVWEGNK